jgi:hypothetical protein
MPDLRDGRPARLFGGNVFLDRQNEQEMLGELQNLRRLPLKTFFRRARSRARHLLYNTFQTSQDLSALGEKNKKSIKKFKIF